MMKIISWLFLLRVTNPFHLSFRRSRKLFAIEEKPWMEALFPEPEWDEETVYKDLYGVSERDDLVSSIRGDKNISKAENVRGKAFVGLKNRMNSSEENISMSSNETVFSNDKSGSSESNSLKELSEMVEKRLNWIRYTDEGTYYSDNSLLDRDSAVQFRDGVRLGKALKVNADRLTYHAKRELSKNKVEKAKEYYKLALEMDPKDGRSYLGLSRIAEREKDLKLARSWLRRGIANSYTVEERLNPFLLQALGCLEERAGYLSEAEALYEEAVKIRPSHAASWVSLGKLRVDKLRMGVDAGRICYETAAHELEAFNKSSSYVFTSWAQIEYEAHNIQRARDLFARALEVDPKCSVAWLKLGQMEASKGNHKEAQNCFESALKNDKYNSRILQAYAIMESKRPASNTRKVIGLFERALKANAKDAGVYQAYALYVANLVGDIDAARKLLKKGTRVNKRHAPVWQAWGVLETRFGTPQTARAIFQQGIWCCAQSGGGQSGGRRCARLWQAWGVLEHQQQDYAAARRCFSRALDADTRNVAAVTAWARMEEDLCNVIDARSIYERALHKLRNTAEKQSLWNSYERMEFRLGNKRFAQEVYRRSVRDLGQTYPKPPLVKKHRTPPKTNATDEIEVLQIRKRNKRTNFQQGKVWIQDGSIEGKLPLSKMKKRYNKK